ncbi:hypothetical protein [Kribbella sp. NPDC051620]|uniref:hypothetical protein n=1 Tax=Kribbella sp. NPDC051620 TaxID=3364120 RepID=UPI0037AFF52A
MAIDSRAVLESRVQAECDELARVAKYLELEVLKDVFEPGDANTLRDQLGDAAWALREALTKNGDSAWVAFELAEPDARRLRAEVFALLQGRLFSAAELDDGISAAARQLLKQVQSRCSVDRPVLVTFSPDPESVDHTIGLIRLRFPGTTIWDLPFAVHEFGHHAVRELPHVNAAHRPERPLLELITGDYGVKAGLTEPHAHELLADAFATFALGPTYPYACTARRINATKLTADTTTHPSWHRRMTVMLATLHRMTAEYDNTRYADTATETVLPFYRSLAGPDPAPPVDQRALETFARKVVERLRRHARGLAYDDADKAVLVNTLLGKEDSLPADLPAGAHAMAVVDAAWRWWRQYPTATDDDRHRVNTLAIDFCRTTNG